MRISNEINKNQQNMNKTFWNFYLIYHNLNKKRTLTLFFNIQLFAGKLISNKNKNEHRLILNNSMLVFIFIITKF